MKNAYIQEYTRYQVVISRRGQQDEDAGQQGQDIYYREHYHSNKQERLTGKPNSKQAYLASAADRRSCCAAALAAFAAFAFSTRSVRKLSLIHI